MTCTTGFFSCCCVEVTALRMVCSPPVCLLVSCTTGETGFSSCRCVEVNVLRVVCSLLVCMLVSCTTGETGFSSCRLVEVTSLQMAVLASTACLFGVRLRKLISSVAENGKFHFCGWCFFLVLTACLLFTTCMTSHSSCRCLEVKI